MITLLIKRYLSTPCAVLWICIRTRKISVPELDATFCQKSFRQKAFDENLYNLVIFYT